MKQKMVQVGPQCRTAADEAKMADPPSSSAHQSTRRQHSLKCETHTPETERSALRRLQQKVKKKRRKLALPFDLAKCVPPDRWIPQVDCTSGRRRAHQRLYLHWRISARFATLLGVGYSPQASSVA